MVGCSSDMRIKGWEQCGLLRAFEKVFKCKPWNPMHIAPFLLVQLIVVKRLMKIMIKKIGKINFKMLRSWK